MSKVKNEFREQNRPSRMQRFTDGLQKFGFKLGSNKVLCSIRDGFGVAGVPMMGMILPVILATVFFNNATLLGKMNGIHDTKGMLWITQHIYPLLMSTQQAATAGLSLLFLVCTAYFMSKNYVTKGSPLTATILAVACFFALAPFGIDWNGAISVDAWTKGDQMSQPFDQINISNIGTNGLLPALFCATTVPYFFGLLTTNEKLRIKLPQTIPPAIADVLTNVISITVLLCSYTLFAWGYAWTAHAANIRIDAAISTSATATGPVDQTYIADTVFSLITNYVGSKLQMLATSPWFTGALLLFMTTFWIFGIHGTNLFTPIQIIILMPSIVANIYFWTVYTNPTIQALIQNSPGTGISDAYYNIVGNLSDNYWAAYNITTASELSTMVSSTDFQSLVEMLKNGADVTDPDVISKVTTVLGNHVAEIMTYITIHGGSGNIVDDMKNVMIGALEGSVYSSVIDPVKGIYVANLGKYYNSIQTMALTGIDSVGGTGMTFGLTYSILLFSKFKPYREVAKLEAVPAVFGINEPIVFGLPIVLNFVIAIPYIFGAVTLSIVGHYMVIWHWVRPLVGMPISFLPAVILPYIMSGFDWRAIVISIVFTIISIGYYSLFIAASARFTLKNTAKQMGVDYKEYVEENRETLFVEHIYKSSLTKEERIAKKEENKQNKLNQKELLKNQKIETIQNKINEKELAKQNKLNQKELSKQEKAQAKQNKNDAQQNNNDQ